MEKKDVVRAILVTAVAAAAARFGNTQRKAEAKVGAEAGAAKPVVTQISPVEAEMTRVAPLTTPGAIENSVRQTTAEFLQTGWQEAVNRGLPEVAVKSSVKINIQYPGGIISPASGSLMKIDNYWVVMTAAHVIESGNPNVGTDAIEAVVLSGDENLPDLQFLGLTSKKFGVATARVSGLDFGMVVFPDEYMPISESSAFSDSVVKRDQINTGQGNLDGEYFGICFPNPERNPYVVLDANLAKFVNEINDSRIVLNTMTVSGCSGGGMFVRNGDNVFYAGPIQAGFGPHPVLAGSSEVANVSSLGEEGFDILIQRAIGDFKTKQ